MATVASRSPGDFLRLSSLRQLFKNPFHFLSFFFSLPSFSIFLPSFIFSSICLSLPPIFLFFSHFFSVFLPSFFSRPLFSHSSSYPSSSFPLNQPAFLRQAIHGGPEGKTRGVIILMLALIQVLNSK